MFTKKFSSLELTILELVWQAGIGKIDPLTTRVHLRQRWEGPTCSGGLPKSKTELFHQFGCWTSKGRKQILTSSLAID